MLNLGLFLLSSLTAVALGLGSAYFTLENQFGFQTTRAGPWVAWTRATSLEADPYTRAHFSRIGALPPPPFESLQFIAETDSAGDAISGDCRYLISGAFPATRYWTLAVFRDDAQLVETPLERHGFANDTVVLSASGGATITLSPALEPGNWLPLKPGETHHVVLTLYDTPLATEAFLIDLAMPVIEKDTCRS